MDILASHYQALTTIHYKFHGSLSPSVKVATTSLQQPCLSSSAIAVFTFFRAVRCSVHSHWTVSETEGEIDNIEEVRMSPLKASPGLVSK